MQLEAEHAVWLDYQLSILCCVSNTDGMDAMKAVTGLIIHSMAT